MREVYELATIAFVPVRGGSKGIINKNIYIIAGKPLVYWVLDALNNSGCVDRIVVATDSDVIKKTVLNFGFNRVEIYDRKPENASDNSATIDVVLEYIKYANLAENDVFLLSQATSPLLEFDDVDKFLNNYQNKGCDSSFSCVEFPRMCWTRQGVPILHDIKKKKASSGFE